MRTRWLVLASVAVAVAGAVLSGWCEDLPTVVQVDLRRYEGTWFEIARLPNRFERKCERDVTAKYTLRPDGKVDVVNACRKANGLIQQVHGTAKTRSRKGPASRLKVTFFWPFYGDYWILDLDPEYRWALVGAPNRKYLWLLSRTPVLDAAVYDRLLLWAKSLGFDSSKVRKTTQDNR